MTHRRSSSPVATVILLLFLLIAAVFVVSWIELLIVGSKTMWTKATITTTTDWRMKLLLARRTTVEAWTTTRQYHTFSSFGRRRNYAVSSHQRLQGSIFQRDDPFFVSSQQQQQQQQQQRSAATVTVPVPVPVSSCGRGGRQRGILFSTTQQLDQDSTLSKKADGESAAIVYQEIQWLSREIRRHDALYYSSNTQQGPELSDDEFDALVQREEQLAQEYPLLLRKWQEESGWGVEATRQGRVGSPGDTTTNHKAVSSTAAFIIAGGQEPRTKRKHLAPMLSLDNVHNDEQLWAWLKRIPKVLDEWDSTEDEPTRVTILTEPKLDGVSLSLRYTKCQKNPNGGTSDSASSSSSSSLSSSDYYKLEWASTRGDGQQGQDVTFAVRSMEHTIPFQFFTTDDLDSWPASIEIRGEVVLPNSRFETLSEWAPVNVTFSNARNAASGILLRKEAEVVEDDESEQQPQSDADQLLRSKLQFFAYEIVSDPQDMMSPLLSRDGEELQGILSEIGFSIPSPVSKTELDLVHNETMEDWTNETIAPMLNYYQALQIHRNEQKATKGYDWGDFEMDGCVHKISQNKMRRLLGRSMKSPKWAVAHKFPPQAVVTKLLDVTVQIGRTGALTPVAVLEPVEVSGVTIQRATLHNFGHLQQVLGGTETAIGTSVLVRRAGDVIPQVVQRVGDFLESETMISLKPPEKCPACGSAVILEDIATSAVGQVVRCGGPPLLCPPRAITSLGHAFSRDAMDVTGLSEARIQQLMDADLLRFPSDIFQFGDEQWTKAQELPRWGPKSCENLRATCERVATTGISLSRFIYSLGARHLGKHSSELVASSYLTKSAFFEAVDAASEWTDVETEDGIEESKHPFSALQGQIGIGPVLIQSLVSFSKSKELVDAAKKLGKAVKILDEEETMDQSISEMRDSAGTNTTDRAGRILPWKGFRVVFTGSIPGYSRTEAHKAAKLLGAKATPGSVSKSTDLVVFGDKGGKKLQQAESLGIRTMTAEEFSALVEEQNETI